MAGIDFTAEIDSIWRLLREKKGNKTLRSTAKEIGISYSSVRRVENGKVPSLETYLKIRAWLGEELKALRKIERPKLVRGTTERVVTGCGNLYLTVNVAEGRPFELFASLGKAGGCAHCQNEAVTRMITLALKYGLPIGEIVDELKNIQCPSPIWSEGKQIKSCADAIAQVLASIES